MRCRPLNQSEKNVKAYSIVDIPSHREIVVKEKPNTNLTKSYQFDRAFGPKSQQLEVYRAVVEPLGNLGSKACFLYWSMRRL